MQNTLFYGDNLDILRRFVDDATVDLVYLDPPFNSNRADNRAASSRFDFLGCRHNGCL